MTCVTCERCDLGPLLAVSCRVGCPVCRAPPRSVFSAWRTPAERATDAIRDAPTAVVWCLMVRVSWQMSNMSVRLDACVCVGVWMDDGMDAMTFFGLSDFNLNFCSVAGCGTDFSAHIHQVTTVCFNQLTSCGVQTIR